MRVLARRLFLLVAVLAFAAGAPLALAVAPVLAAGPCPDEHHLMAGEAHHHENQPASPRQHRHDAAACLYCCVGACVAVPDLARGPTVAVVFTTAPVVYADTAAALVGRSLRPDPAPPRTGAPSQLRA